MGAARPRAPRRASRSWARSAAIFPESAAVGTAPGHTVKWPAAWKFASGVSTCASGFENGKFLRFSSKPQEPPKAFCVKRTVEGGAPTSR